MYTPKHFEERDVTVLHALIRSHPLGAWVTHAEGGLIVNHIPFLVDSTRGAYGTLIGHVARANAVWKSFSKETASVVIFQGPQTYITPSWYPTKHAHGKAVPTWNYAVVHAHGTPCAIEDRDWLFKHVSKLSNLHESERAVPWSVTDAPPDYVEAQLKAIVGIEIPISTLFGKWKTSQNRSLPDKLGTIAGLYERRCELNEDGGTRTTPYRTQGRLTARC
jgi:transcriptional regulator